MSAVASQTAFRSENGLISKECCCCSKDGCVKDISTEYYDLGVREMYSEIIKDTFNINLQESNIIFKQYICNLCITQLKNAYVFKSNILKNHKAMVERMNKLNNPSKEDVKCVKNELYEDEYFGDEIGEGILYDGAKEKPSDLKLCKKSEITRKRLKFETKPKQLKRKDDLDNKQKSKTSKIIAKTNNRRKKVFIKSRALRNNSLNLISNSSIWAFSWNEGWFRCFCCKEPYSDIGLLKKHTESHKIEEIEKKIQISENSLVKVEVSDIFCKICQQNFDNLNSLIDHFKVHNIVIAEHILVPIKINELICQICNEKHTNFYVLYKHMITHYQTCICEKCGSGFNQKRHLKAHIKKYHNPNRIKTTQRRQMKCYYCNETFKQFCSRIEHMVEKHGLKRPEFPCHLCTKIYTTKGILNAHIKNSHCIKDKVYKCDVCLKIFSLKHSLTRHKDTHTEGLNYNCLICNHGFKLASSLRRHVKKKHKS